MDLVLVDQEEEDDFVEEVRRHDLVPQVLKGRNLGIETLRFKNPPCHVVHVPRR